jgi:hypothetical protein
MNGRAEGVTFYLDEWEKRAIEINLHLRDCAYDYYKSLKILSFYLRNRHWLLGCGWSYDADKSVFVPPWIVWDLRIVVVVRVTYCLKRDY